MYIVEQFYKKVLKKEPPYYTKHAFVTIMWKPIRKYINVVIITNVPFPNLRVALYRIIEFTIGKNVFICMRCNIISGEEGVIIGENTIVSAGSLVNRDILSNATTLCMPIKVLGGRKEV